MENKKGKVSSIRNFWIIKSEITQDNYSMCEWKTRKIARNHMKICKTSKWYKNVNMYKVTEVTFGDGKTFTTMEKAR